MHYFKGNLADNKVRFFTVVLVNQVMLQWVRSGIGLNVPPNSVVAFVNVHEDSVYYIGRFVTNNMILSVAVNPMSHQTFATFQGNAILTKRYEVRTFLY